MPDMVIVVVLRGVIVGLIRSMVADGSRGGEDDSWREDDGWLRANDVLEGCKAAMVRLGTELLLPWSVFWVSPSWWRWRSVNASTRNEREAEKRKCLARTTDVFKVVEERRRKRRREEDA
jgi:hypothetical protein